jgi:hypothetical protein
MMAKKSSGRRITRRDAITLIGAGAISGTASPAEAQPPHPSCDHPGAVTHYKKSANNAIVSLTCCEETKNAILVGVEEQGKKATLRGKTHLKPLRDRLINDQLLEYCFMLWGLDQKQAQSLFDRLPKELGLELEKGK